MDARLQRRVQRYGWDKAAAVYEQFWWQQLKPAQDRVLELADLKLGEHVVEVAAGTGLVTSAAAAAVGPQGRVTATDLSEAMVTVLRARAAERGLTQIAVDRMDAEELQLPDASCDVALCALGLMYVPDPVRALREMHRVLKPGGRVAVAVWGARPRCGWAEIFPIVERRVASEVCPLFFQLGTGDALETAFDMADFASVATERIVVTLDYPSATTACSAAFEGGPVALAYSRFDEPTRAAVREEYLASVAPYRREVGYAIPGEFVLGAGTKPA